MFVVAIDSVDGAVSSLERQLDRHAGKDLAWALMYTVEGAPIAELVAAARRKFPGLPVFGATSFQGVFSSQGFHRGAGILFGERSEPTRVAVTVSASDARQAFERARSACSALVESLGGQPQMLLLHATPGFEEKVLAGIASVFSGDVPVYGGSAADDEIAGQWRVFANESVVKQGFLLVGIVSDVRPSGGFLSGYLPTEHTGKVTRADGRIVHEIDGRPAAVVYNEWAGGAIAGELDGGNVLLKTNLLPLARTKGLSLGMPRRLLSHPHQVIEKTGSLAFFTELSVGDTLTLMTTMREPLVTRVRRVVQRARGARGRKPRGGLLVYCGGCLGVVLDQAGRISDEFNAEMDGAPFLGIATFGEQGAFFDKGESHHGNLMCSAVIL